MATYYVSKSGDDANDGSDYANSWLTIQHAVDNVADGDTIYVGSGVYEENVVYPNVLKDTVLRADGYVVMEGSTIRGTAVTMSAFYGRHNELHGLLIRNYELALNNKYTGGFELYNCYIKNCNLTNYVFKSRTHTIGQNTVFDNVSLIEYSADANTATFTLRNCTLTENQTINGTNITLIIESCDFNGDLDFGEADLTTLDYCNIRGSITYKGTTYNALADFQAAYPDLAPHSINKEPDFNDDYTLRWSSPNLGAGEAGADIGARGAATYYTSTGDLFDGATLTDVSRDENGDFKLDNGATTGTIVSAVLDFGADLTLGNIRWLSTETYPLDVIDSDNTDSAPNRREIEYRSQTDAQGSFAQGDAEPPNWTDVERNDDLSLSCRYFQVRITLRDNGAEA